MHGPAIAAVTGSRHQTICGSPERPKFLRRFDLFLPLLVAREVPHHLITQFQSEKHQRQAKKNPAGGPRRRLLNTMDAAFSDSFSHHKRMALQVLLPSG